MDIPSKKVLITGIDSFTGQHLGKHLSDQGYEVFGTSIGQSGERIFKADISDARSLISIIDKVKPEYYVHLAGISFVGYPDKRKFYEVNTIGTQHLLDAILESEHSPKKVLLPSSAAVYGNQGKELLVESMIPKPNSHYGCSKLSMELLSANYFNKIPIIITRPFNYTGPGQDANFLVPKIVKAFQEKAETIQLGNIHVFREFNSVKRVCMMYSQLLESTASSLVVNICSGRAISISEIISTLENIASHKIKVEVNEKFVRKNEIVRLEGSTELLQSIIDFHTTKDDLHQMLSAMTYPS